jgi:Fe2+ or Zn2+ uptake regulation protein
MSNGEHMTVKQISNKMDGANVASIYNNLFEFQQRGIVFSVTRGRQKLYELNTMETMHDSKFAAHLIDSEGNILDVDCAKEINDIFNKFASKYSIKSIQIEISE